MKIIFSFLLIRKVSCYFLFELINDFVGYYEDMFFPSSIGAWAILAGSFFVTFYGIRFPRISLAPYIAAIVYYNFCDIKEGINSISPKTVQTYHIPPDILQGSKDLLGGSSTDPVSLWVVSLFLASALVWFLEIASGLLFVAGLYVIYRMFFHIGFEKYKETDPEIFYTLFLGSFVILYYVTRRMVKYLLILLFAVTGSLILLVSIELITENYALGFYDLILDLEDTKYLEVSSLPAPLSVWIITSFIGMFWQWRSSPDKN
ncbi:uncharacterized protein Eint_030290 [Encephalitozoon intestinalis ATCC 50506]|uniref:Uncharacterized protein n=1 Tax=Encephalitozoon intestinalis (strain ATCC 50506) TaxID=876142 RepID=E0S638_ENCIT|nr:uncharacterized protein Eint_030290 [Encephalitozoon intestinalis ATCC 50506]ADM11173.1 hypothetical protein Eint_030290 [Encephalitozoon intestinalis ATCC 50506]UTX44839.1 hypothetical protein GPK93_03g03660 [Encephalitozoon intestinalis]